METSAIIKKKIKPLGAAMLFVLATSCAQKDLSEEMGNEHLSENSSLIFSSNFIPVDSIQQISETPSAGVERDRLGQSFRATDFMPTGFYLEPNSTLTIEAIENVTGTSQSKVWLAIGTYSRYSDKWNPEWVELDWGVNTVQADEYGGIVWVYYNNYYAPNEVPTGQATVRFIDGFKRFPLYKYGETTQSEWHEMLNTYADAPDVTLEGEAAYIVVSRAKALEFKNKDQDRLLELATQILDVEAYISGLDGSSADHERNLHKILMTETDTPDYYMVATDYRTAYSEPNGGVDYIINPDLLYQQGWGPWHELGHMHQQQAWKWSGLGEVTVNIYSLAVERAMGVTPSRLNRDGVWNSVADYMNSSINSRNFNSNKVGVWMRLAMFHQLWLAYGDGFYINLHKQTREEDPQVSTDGEKMKYFMLKACTISGKDLTDFFKKWGFKFNGSNAVYAQIAVLNLPSPGQDLTLLVD